MKKIDVAQSFKNLGQWFKSIPQMDKKILTLNIIKIICYLCTFPALFIATMVICGKVGEGMTFYGFWPYLAGIIVVLLGIVFTIVALLINRKKAKKRTIMEKTAILLVVVILLTAGLGLIFDIALPDILAKYTFGTLYVEDMYHRGVEESRVVEDYIHLFIGLNILNGNYDGELYYEHVKADPLTEISTNAIIADKDFNIYVENLDPESYKSNPDAALRSAFEEYWFDKLDKYTELDRELYDFIYEHYVLMDYDHELNNTVNRRAFCLALVDVYKDTYKKLCKEGFKTNSIAAVGCTGNEKLTAIYGQNYASQDMDGYIPINEDSGIAYVTNGRMTTPLIIRMFLNDSYNYTTPIYDEDGKTVVGYDGFLAYLYRPEVKEAYEANGGTYVDGKSAELFEYEGAYYYVHETGHVDTPINWCILDLLGEPFPLAEIDVDGMLGGMKDIGELLDLLGGIGGLLNSQSGDIEELLEGGFNERLIYTVSGGQELHLNVYVTDDGAVAATLYPQGMRNGYIGYQYMAWLEMGSLLTAVCGLVQTRNLLYIFSAIMAVMLIVIAFLDTSIQKRKQVLVAEMSQEGEAEAQDACQEAEAQDACQEEETTADEMQVEDVGDSEEYSYDNECVGAPPQE